MKRVVSILCFMLITASALWAVTPPEAVLKAFEARFPDAQHISWAKENAHEFEAEFVWKGQNHSANFTDTGLWLETESSIAFDQLPLAVQQSFQAAHKVTDLKAQAIIETSQGITHYEIEIKKGAITRELFYKADGSQFHE